MTIAHLPCPATSGRGSFDFSTSVVSFDFSDESLDFSDDSFDFSDESRLIGVVVVVILVVILPGVVLPVAVLPIVVVAAALCPRSGTTQFSNLIFLGFNN